MAVVADAFVVLGGGYEVGGFQRITNGPDEGRWSWGASLGAAAANFVATGYATAPEAVPDSHWSGVPPMLARADLRERPDARPGPPRRERK